jgi:hypothetical protein
VCILKKKKTAKEVRNTKQELQKQQGLECDWR